MESVRRAPASVEGGLSPGWGRSYHSRMPSPRALPLVLCVVLASASCGGPQASSSSVSPVERVLAAGKTGKGATEIPLKDLIVMLDDADPAVRLVAINQLERRTGETRGYRHYDPFWVRARAVDRWQAWLESGGEEASSSAVEAVDTDRAPSAQDQQIGAAVGAARGRDA